MGLKFWDLIRPKNGKVTSAETSCRELFESATELQIRELCFWTCVNMVANAIGRCEFRTFRNNEEIFEHDYYLWNYEPNVNQSSTAFFHKLVAKLYTLNEALVISTRKRDGTDALVVADEWQLKAEYPSKMNEYTDVVVGDVIYEKTFRENDVLHLKLNHVNVKPIVDGIYRVYSRVMESAMADYEWAHGKHWKVHVDQIEQGKDGWKEAFQKMINDQLSPFFKSRIAVLPEFDGYTYEEIGGGAGGDTRDIKALVEDIFDFTARAFLIPAVLVNGKIEGTEDANTRFLTNVIDPICDQLQEEITRKRYGFEEWRSGNFLRVDSSSIIHFDLFGNAANVEKLVGSGAYTINDVRRAANQSTINEPWANEHYMTLNISTMGEATRALGEKKGVEN